MSFRVKKASKTWTMATVTAKALEQMMQAHVKAETGMSLEQATPRDYWTALSKSIVEIISENWMATRHKYNQGRQAHYFSAEFLEGRSMLNNLVNLGIYDQAKEAGMIVEEDKKKNRIDKNVKTYNEFFNGEFKPSELEYLEKYYQGLEQDFDRLDQEVDR